MAEPIMAEPIKAYMARVLAPGPGQQQRSPAPMNGSVSALTAPPVPVPPSDGVSLFALIPHDPPTTADKAACRTLFDEMLEPVSDAVWDQLFRLVADAGWNREQFRRAADAIVKTKTWIPSGAQRPVWSIGDWFRDPTPKLYSYTWYLQQIEASAYNGKLIGAYQVAGHPRPLFGWKHEVRDALPPFPIEAQELAERQLNQTRPVPAPPSFRDTVEHLRLKEAVDRLERENRALKLDADRLRRALEGFTPTELAEEEDPQ